MSARLNERNDRVSRPACLPGPSPKSPPIVLPLQRAEPHTLPPRLIPALPLPAEPDGLPSHSPSAVNSQASQTLMESCAQAAFPSNHAATPLLIPRCTAASTGPPPSDD